MSDQKSGSAYSPKKENASNASGQKPDALQLAQAIAELRYITALYKEAVNAMVDGVTLGAENVQDKRIEILEAGPATTTEGFIATIVMTLILEGTVGPAVAALATRLLMRPIMKGISRAIYRQSRLETKKLGYTVRLFRKEANEARVLAIDNPGSTSNLIANAEALEKSAELLANDLRKNVAATRTIRNALNSTTAFVENNLVAAAKTPGAVSGQQIGGAPLTAGASTGTDLLAAAMASASSLRLTLAATHEALEAELQDPDNTIERIAELLDQYRPAAQIDLAAIRYAYALSTEAMIWAALLLDEEEKDIMRNRNDIKTTNPAVDFLYSQTEHRPMKLRTSDALRKYLRTRLATEIERYVKENSVWTGTYAGVQRPAFGPKQTETEKDDLLVAYLASVADGIPKDIQLF